MHAVIYNACLQTFGGGERLTYAMASGLVRLGMRVTVLTTEPVLPTHAEIARFFGPGYDGFALRRCDRADLAPVLAEHDLMVNHTAGDETVNPCRRGYYLVMFPFQERGPFLSTYDRYLCISEYTARHTRARWNVGDRLTLLPPSVGAAPATRRRKKQIAVLGRFNRQGHDKNQERLIGCFERFVAAHREWKLVLVGRRQPNVDDPVPAIAARVRDLPVEIHADVDDATRQRLLAESALLWHGAGLGVDEAKDPERLEHFGIAVVEAMSAGVVPIVYARGGPAEIVEPGASGLHYRSENELVAQTRLLAERDDVREALRAAAVARAEGYGAVAFAARLGEIFVP